MAEPNDQEFPAEVYARTVLAPLFLATAQHYAVSYKAIDRAHLVMMRECRIVTEPHAIMIARALDAIDRTLDPGTLAYTGEFEDFFFLREAALREQIGPDIAGRLHTGRSRNDIDHTVFKLALMRRITGMSERSLALARAMLGIARRERDTLIVAYTHGQPAQPTTLGHYVAAALEVLLRDLHRLAAARDVVDLCPMGAAAITTSGFPLDRRRIADLLGFAAPLENSYGCIASVDYITGAYSSVELLFLHLGRLVQDLHFWTSAEVGQLHVPDGFVQISSIMPQKRNPVPIEHLRLLASHAAGRARAILAAMHNTPFTDMNDSECETQVQGYGAFELGSRALDLLSGLLGAVRVNGDRVRRNLDRSGATLTELADRLVRQEGISFREAHEIAAAVARAVAARNGTLADEGYEAFEAAFLRMRGRRPGLDVAAFRETVSPENFVAVRDRLGGPAPASMDAACGRLEAEIERLQSDLRALTAREAAAAADLDAAFSALLAGRA